MVRIRGRLVVLNVAARARHIEAGVNSAGVTLRAGNGDVRPGQGELGLRGVVERGTQPIRRGVAELAILRESGRGVVRILGRLIILHVTRKTGRAQTLVNTTRVTLETSGGRVLAGERECGLRGVIEGGSVPIRRRMAELAILRESGGGVVRIIRRLIILHVTRRTGRTQTLVNAARVTLEASGGRMLAGERERGLRGVIEGRSVPIDRAVALRAVLR